MAARLLPAALKPDMLVLADRNFYGFKLWQTACASGAVLAWRVKANLKAAGGANAARWLVSERRL